MLNLFFITKINHNSEEAIAVHVVVVYLSCKERTLYHVLADALCVYILVFDTTLPISSVIHMYLQINHFLVICAIALLACASQRRPSVSQISIESYQKYYVSGQLVA